MYISRRSLLAGVSLAALAGCTGTGALTPAQVLADATGAVQALTALVPDVAMAAPKLLPAAVQAQVMDGLKLATALLQKLTTSTPAASAAGTLQTVEGYIVDALQALAAVTPAAAAAFPALAPYVVLVQAVAAMVPVLATFINGFVAAPIASLPALAAHPVMTPAAARLVLHIPTVG